MARKGFAAALNRALNFVGLVDTDEEPQRSSSRMRDDDYDSSRRSGYTPSARRNDRPQQERQAQRSSSRNAGSYNGANRSGNRSGSRPQRERDTYDEWNTAPRKTNRYADSIYDDDTTLRGNARSYDDDFGYEDRRDTRSASRRSDRFEEEYTGRHEAGMRSRDAEEPQEERRPAPVESRSARSRSGEVVVFDVNDLEDCRMVILALIESKTVIISVEALDKPMIRRVEDTLCGAVCALNATIRRTSEVSYVIAPSSIEVKGTRRTVERRY